MKKLLAIAAIALLASACQEAPQSDALPGIRFSQPPFRVNVAEVRVENQTPARPNDISNQMPTAPATAVQQWVQDRIVAQGRSGVMVVTINEASVLETKLPKTEGIKGFFTDDQDAKYDGAVVVTFRVYSGASAMADAEASVNVTRGRTLNEKATLADRERFYHDLVNDMMQRFNAEADSRMRQYLMNFISY